MLLKINPYEIVHQIFVSNFGLEKYSYIIKHVNQVNVAENTKHGKNNSMDFLRLQKYRTPLLMKL